MVASILESSNKGETSREGQMQIMKPSVEEIKGACPELEPRLIQAHLTRLSERYFSRFSRQQILRHLRALSNLSAEQPVQVLLDPRGNRRLDCTVLSFDHPSLFSLIAGVFAGLGFDVISGDVFTYQRARAGPVRLVQRGRRQRRSLAPDPLKRRRIVDYFSGVVQSHLSFEDWAEVLREKLQRIIALLEKGGSESTNQARHLVNEMVVERLSHLRQDAPPFLYPVEIEVDNDTGPYTRLLIVSQDTPAFLYSLTNALSLHGISIEHVRIRTIHGRVEDEIEVADNRGNKIDNPELLGRIKLSVLLTKQFTYFLDKAPDPYAALCRFETLVGKIWNLPGRDEWLAALSDPHALRDLARLLGASDLLWEDFIRLHCETLLPILRPLLGDRRVSQPPETLSARLRQALEGAETAEEQRRRLNGFKDREIFLIDLDYILNPDTDFRKLAERLTRLAEAVVNTVTELAYSHLRQRFGTPRTAAGLPARYAILGLGKLGGAALGYASDIEFLLIYSDNGWTDGEESIANSEFFERLVKNISWFILAKREGIFHVDLRLRPYGNAGPLACSLENFCRYYGPAGPAHSYERLALVRLRRIGGDPGLGGQVERIRDELLYLSQSIDLDELRQLREKQFQEKTEGGKLNAKFSPGGLVDLEYDVQILQVIYGKEVPELRTPQIHEALSALDRAGVLSATETEQLIAAYDFLRRLINAMRMLRGSARDLFLPAQDSLEFAALARRMGYRRGEALDPAQQLYLDFETHTAAVRAFAEHHFGRDSLPGPSTGTVADLVLSESLPPNLRQEILAAAGFRNTERAYRNLRALAGSGSRRHTFARLALLATDILRQTPDPDMALNNWERYIRTVPSAEFHYNLLLSQPMRLEMLLSIFAGSQFLADTLVRNPGFLHWLTIPENLHGRRSREDLERELWTAAAGCQSHRSWLNQLRRFRRREILRIGVRDIYLGVAAEEVMLELSTLAEALCQVSLKRVWAGSEDEKKKFAGNLGELENCFCILAFGKLGGRELNYSSDIDLMGIFEASAALARRLGLDAATLKYLFAWVMERVTLELSLHTEEGYAYRVDLRLRPYGKAGELVPALPSLVDYYLGSASLWEIQAALKLRPVAGNIELGHRFLERIQPLFRKRHSRDQVISAIEKMRSAAISKSSRQLSPGLDVKSGLGGLRDVEFLVQGLQLIHAPDRPGLLHGNTLAALEALRQAELLPEAVATRLRQDYLFLRRVEHYLQILEDRQIHTLPKEPAGLNALARRVLGPEATGASFMEELDSCRRRVRRAYTAYLLGRT